MKVVCLLVLVSSYFSTLHAQFVRRSSIVKIEATSPVFGVEYGTGNIVGSEQGYLYVLTAAHVVFPLNEEGEIIDSTPTIKVIIDNTQNDTTKYISFFAEVIAKDHPRDILVAKIPVVGLSGNAQQPFEYGFMGFTRGFDTLSECASLYSSMSITGFSGGASKETETLSGQLYTRTLSDDSKYFVMKNIPVEVGFSGSLVQSLDGQILGMLLSKMNGNRAKIVKLETIDILLKANSIPHNLMKRHPLMGQWRCDSIVLPPGGPVRSLTRDKKMIFKSDGTVEGLGNGTFCFTPDGIQLNSNDTLQTPNGDFTIIHFLALESGSFKLDDPSDPYMWNFSGPNPTRKRLSNNRITIYLTKND